MVCEEIVSNGRLMEAMGPSSISLVLEVLISTMPSLVGLSDFNLRRGGQPSDRGRLRNRTERGGQKRLVFCLFLCLSVCLSVRHAFERQSLCTRFRHEGVGVQKRF